MTAVTLTQMMEARERRAQCQRRLTARYGLPLVSFTLNIPGPVKRNPLIERAYRYGLKLLRARFRPLYTAESILDTGCEALLVARGDPAALKKMAVGVEDADEIGRLFDIDVMDEQGRQVSREALGLDGRACLVCGGPAHECARSRAHGVDLLFARTQQIIRGHFGQAHADRVSVLAQRALLYEVAATPKPGLVDRRDSGAHSDMDIFSFMASAAALGPYLRRCVLLGIDGADRPPQALFFALKEPGLRAEQAMYAATGGVNTHKGAVYSMGLACAAAGVLHGQNRICTPQALLSLCADMTRQSARSYFAALTPRAARTAGERLYLQHGLEGARGEAANGFPSVLSVGLPCLNMALKGGLSINDAACVTLIHLIAAVPDTVMIARSSYQAWTALTQDMKKSLAADPLPDPAQIERLNRAFIQGNLSPGGCADLLALTLFIHFMVTEN